MKRLDALRNRLRIGAPPSREETFETLERPPETSQRRVKTGRTEQLNARVTRDFKKRVEQLAADNRDTIGGILDEALKAFESGAAQPQHGVPVAEARSGRTRQLRLWSNEAVYDAVSKVARERGMSVSALFEDLIAHEVRRLYPADTKLGVILEQ